MKHLLIALLATLSLTAVAKPYHVPDNQLTAVERVRVKLCRLDFSRVHPTASWPSSHVIRVDNDTIVALGLAPAKAGPTVQMYCRYNADGSEVVM